MKEALGDADWINLMKEELYLFERSKVWYLVPRPVDRTVIGTRWVFRNKIDGNVVITSNKSILDVQGYNQVEGIDYDSNFCSYCKGGGYQNSNSLCSIHGIQAISNGDLKEEVFVKKPPGFEDVELPDHVFKLNKDLYGLKQVPRAWYESLSKFLLKNGFKRGKIDNTLLLL